MNCLKCAMRETCKEIHLNHTTQDFHYLMQVKYWEGFSPIQIESNLIFRPYFFNKVRILGKLDLPRFFEMRYKTNEWQRKFI